MKIYMGWDSETPRKYLSAIKSLYHQNTPASVEPIILDEMKTTFGFDFKVGSTEFSYTRFLVPALNAYDGWALFVDNDVIFLEDPLKIIKEADEKYAVMVVKHNAYDAPTLKFGNRNVVNENYNRKNWSSVMLFNCGHSSTKKLTPKIISGSNGLYLHQFQWAKDSEIGSLNSKWNYLVDVNDGIQKDGILHFTHGNPIKNTQHYDTWKYYQS